MSDEAKRSTRVSQAPDWMISGLVRAAAFAEDEQASPMFNTGVTFAQLRDQVRALLGRSGLDLTKQEMSSGTHWLTQRIANQITEADTKETLLQKLGEYTMQYVTDKSVQRATGVSERSPIYDREWYDKHFTPPTDRNAAAEEKKKSEPKGEDGAEPVDMVYVGLDGDDMGHLVEDSLLSDDPEVAAKISDSIHDAHRAIRKLVAGVGGRLIFDGGDNMLFYMVNEPEVFESIREVHKRITKHSVTIGVGHRPIEAHYALVVGKNTGKDKTVVYDESVKAQHATIHQEQQQLEETQKKLKYRASALDQMGKDMEISRRLRDALSSQGMDSSDKAVKELFWRLIQQYDLSDVYAIDLFFAGADDAELVAALGQTYARRLDWAVHARRSPSELTKTEAQSILQDLARAIESGAVLDVKFQELLKAVDDDALKHIDMAGDVVQKRIATIANEFAEMYDEGKTLIYSHYVDELRAVCSEITSMVIPADQALVTAITATLNAESGLNGSIDVGPVVKILTKWLERMNIAAMVLDMVCVVSGARPMEMVAADPSSQPIHFPGQSQVPGGAGQKSPYAKHDWMSIEDYNRDKVDWTKTDDQYTSTNVPAGNDDMPQKMVGGDVGGNPIYVP